MTIDTAQDLVTLFAGHVTHVARELKSPCPICAKYEHNGTGSLADGTPVAGDDRLVWFIKNDDTLSGFLCRGCKEAGRTENGYWSISNFIDEAGWSRSNDLWDNLEIDLSTVPGGGSHRNSKRKTVEQSDYTVTFSTRYVDRKFWRSKTGWSDEIIEAARCGRKMRRPGRDQQQVFFNTIPVPLLDLDTGKERTIFTYRHPTDKTKKLQDSGSQKNCISHIRVNEDDLCVIAEGEVDGITAAYGLQWNTVIALGSTKWQKPYAQYLREQGYTRVIVLGDNDEAGRSLAGAAADDLIVSGLSVERIEWPKEYQEGYDITDMHHDVGLSALREFISTHVTPMQLDKEVVDAGENEALVEDIDILRGEGPGSIRHAIKTFVEDEEMDVLVLKVGAGIGKTYSLISHLEAILGAQVEIMDQKLSELHNRLTRLRGQRTTVPEDRVEPLEREIRILTNKIAAFNRNVAVVFTPYKDTVNAYKKMIQKPDAWFHYEGRSQDNCEQHSLVQLLGSKAHSQMNYCEKHCPVREMCEKNGFLSQRTAINDYYLITARHEHFTPDFLSDTGTRAELLILDESPMKMVDSRIISFSEDDVLPFNDALDFDPDPQIPVADVRTFLEAVRYVIRESNRLVPVGSSDPAEWSAAFIPENGMYGWQIYEQIDQEMLRLTNNRLHLKNLLDAEFADYIRNEVQPNYQEGDDLDNIRLRCLPDLIDVMLAELNDATPRSSNIALVDGVMYVNTGRPFDFIKGRKVIVLDATANETLYRLAFPGMNVEIFERYAKNDNATTYQLVGHDFSTLSTNRNPNVRGLGSSRHVQDVEVDVSHLFDDAIDQVPAYRFIRDVVVSLSQSHKTLLVLARKAVIDHVEAYVRDKLKEEFGTAYDSSRYAFVYYGSDKGRGSNDFEDYEAVVAFGRFRLRYGDVYRKALVWSRLSGAETIIPATMIQKERILTANGTTEVVKYRTFADPIGDQLVQQIEDAEVEQAIARIRPHSSKGRKTIYAFTSAAAAPFVDGVYDYKEFAKEHMGIGKVADKLQEYKEWLFTRFISEGYTEHPTYAETFDHILEGSKNRQLVSSLRKASDDYLQELAANT